MGRWSAFEGGYGAILLVARGLRFCKYEGGHMSALIYELHRAYPLKSICLPEFQFKQLWSWKINPRHSEILQASAYSVTSSTSSLGAHRTELRGGRGCRKRPLLMPRFYPGGQGRFSGAEMGRKEEFKVSFSHHNYYFHRHRALPFCVSTTIAENIRLI